MFPCENNIYQLSLWTTTDSLLKKIEHFFKDRDSSYLSLNLFSFEEFEEKSCSDQLILIDEGQIEEFSPLFSKENTLFFILGTELTVKRQLASNVIFIRSLDDLFENFDFLLSNSTQKYLNNLKQCSIQNLKEVVRKGNSKDFQNWLEGADTEEIEQLYQLHERLINGEPLLSIECKEIFNREIYTLDTFLSTEYRFEVFSAVFLPFLSGQEQNSILFINSEFEFLELAKLRLILSFYRCVGNEAKEQSVELKSLTGFPFPIVLLKGDEVSFYNDRLIELNLSSRDLKKMGDMSLFESDDSKYTVSRTSFLEYDLFIFRPYLSEHGDKNISSQELGIITSSIAHELNNPLAGILSAVTVLELEDFWSEQDLECLSDIRITAIRSKQIVEIFLGFSRSSLPSDQNFFMKELLDQAIELIRFRSAELDIRINLHAKVNECKRSNLNGPIVTMLFYLLFSELLTLFNHDKLIDQKRINDHVIDIYMSFNDIEENLELELSDISPVILSKLAGFIDDSRLIDHLLSLMGETLMIDSRMGLIQLKGQKD